MLLLAAVLELGQHLVPGRHAHFGDAAMKALGGVLGLALALAAQRRFMRHADGKLLRPDRGR
jgi:hypothetical protein